MTFILDPLRFTPAEPVAPEFISVNTLANMANAASWQVPMPAGAQVGDLILGFGLLRTADFHITGWTVIRDGGSTVGNSEPTSVWAKYIDGAEGTHITFTKTSADDIFGNGALGLALYRGTTVALATLAASDVEVRDDASNTGIVVGDPTVPSLPCTVVVISGINTNNNGITSAIDGSAGAYTERLDLGAQRITIGLHDKEAIATGVMALADMTASESSTHLTVAFPIPVA